jgi:antagonist of KipI
MSILVVKPGMSAAIQDAGRKGHRSSGVPLSGAMDPVSFSVANLLCGNAMDAPVLEITLHGLELLFEDDLPVALSGGGSVPTLDDIPLPLNRSLVVPAGSLLRFMPSPSGCRMYLALGGGIASQSDLGSCSTYEAAGLGGNGGRRLQKGDRIQRGGPSELCRRIFECLTRHEGNVSFSRWGAALANPLPMESPCPIRCMKGPEWDGFETEVRDDLFKQGFTVAAESNRMGIRLKGMEGMRMGVDEMVSSGVCPGTVQMAHDGTLLLLMADAQTTGGYPRIAQVAGADMARCAQLRPGDVVRFIETDLREAEKALLDMKRSLRILSHAIHETMDRQ